MKKYTTNVIVRASSTLSKFVPLLLILTAGVGLSYESASAASWDFAVFGDTQSPTDPSGVNSTVATAIATDISTNHNVDFALVAGDLVYFNPTTSGLETQFQNFKTAMTDGGLKLAGTGGPGVDYYPVRGNHEFFSESGSIPAWQAEFGNFLPQNGPTTASGGGGNSEVGATYSFIHNNALILSLDEYQNQTGGEPTVNQAWVNAQLAANPGLKVFTFGHTPAYEINNSCLAGNQALRNNFLTSLFNAGGVIYFAGHDHLNALARVYDGDPASGGTQRFYQAVIGAGGAPSEDFGSGYAAD